MLEEVKRYDNISHYTAGIAKGLDWRTELPQETEGSAQRLLQGFNIIMRLVAGKHLMKYNTGVYSGQEKRRVFVG
jgi:hypothetical protein